MESVKIIVRDNFEKMGETAAQILLGEMYQDRRVNLSITAGATPKTTYNFLSKIVKENKEDFNNVHYYNFDNIEMEGTECGITMRDLYNDYFTPAQVDKSNIHALHIGNYLDIQKDIEQTGGLDLMLIGLGADGHFCGNIPGTTRFDKYLYTAPFRSIFQNEPMMKSVFGDKEMPEECVTMGAPALMKAKKLVLIVNGKHKADAVKKMIESPVDEMFPSSILKLHSNFVVILDKDAASRL